MLLMSMIKKDMKKWILNSAYKMRKITHFFAQTCSSSLCVHFSCIFLSIYSICEIIFFPLFTFVDIDAVACMCKCECELENFKK